jgi:hypothetical protein
MVVQMVNGRVSRNGQWADGLRKKILAGCRRFG